MHIDHRPPCRKCGSQDHLWVAEAMLDGSLWNHWVCRRCCYAGLYQQSDDVNALDYDELAERHIEYHERR